MKVELDLIRGVERREDGWVKDGREVEGYIYGDVRYLIIGRKKLPNNFELYGFGAIKL